MLFWKKSWILDQKICTNPVGAQFLKIRLESHYLLVSYIVQKNDYSNQNWSIYLFIYLFIHSFVLFVLFVCLFFASTLTDSPSIFLMGLRGWIFLPIMPISNISPCCHVVLVVSHINLGTYGSFLLCFHFRGFEQKSMPLLSNSLGLLARRPVP